MKEIALTAVIRVANGKGAAHRTRSEGNIPAIIYGPEIDPISIAVNEKEIRTAMKNASSSSIINLNVDGKENRVVLREIQRDPITSKVTHLDFHAISMTRPIKVSVPIILVGTPIGVKTDGGIMQTTLRELDISCLPGDIPDQIEVDVSELSIGESVHVNELELDKVTILTELQRTIVVISAPTVVKAATVEGEEEEGEEGVEGEEAAEGEAAEGAEGEKKAEGAEGEKKAEGKEEKKK